MEVGLTEVCDCYSGVSSFAACYFVSYAPLNDVSIPCTSFGVIQAMRMAACCNNNLWKRIPPCYPLFSYMLGMSFL